MRDEFVNTLRENRELSFVGFHDEASIDGIKRVAIVFKDERGRTCIYNATKRNLEKPKEGCFLGILRQFISKGSGSVCIAAQYQDYGEYDDIHNPRLIKQL